MKSVILSLLFTLSLWAQGSQVVGIISDAKGGAVPDARIDVQSGQTGLTRHTQTSQDGNYSIPALPPGRYSMRVQKDGFRTLERTGLDIAADTNVRLDLELVVGDLAQKITVEEEVPVLHQDTAEVATSVTPREFDRLPLLQVGRMRTPTGFVYLSSGVQGQISVDGTNNTAASNWIVIHGLPNFTSEIWLEGLPFGRYEVVGSINESAPSVEAVREFRLLTTQLPAEFGNSGPAVTSLTLKSGVNQLHGSAFDYFRNDDLDSRSWFSAQRATIRLNEFAASLGGPVVIPGVLHGQDRTFFYVTIGGSRKRGLDQYSKVQIPTPENLKGDFSRLRDSRGNPILIYDPASTRGAADGSLVRDAFPGNIIPQQRIDPVAAKIAAYYPQPNLTGSLNFGGFGGEKMLDPSSYTVKVDHAITDRQRITAVMQHTDIPRLTNTTLPAPYTGGINQEIRSWTARLNLETVASQTLLNNVYLGFNRFTNPTTPPVPLQDWATVLGLRGSGADRFPVISFGDGYTTLGQSNFLYSVNVDWSLLAKDNVTLVRGAHIIKIGGEWRRNQLNNWNNGYTSGNFLFSNAHTANPAAISGTGNSFASFLLGGAASVNTAQPFATGLRRSYAGIFASDEWRINPKLTFTLGLRWEFQTAPYEQWDRSGTVDLKLPNPAAGNLPGAVVFAGSGTWRTGGRALLDTDFSAIGPRFGLAWRALDRVTLRGGYGIYYSNNYLNIYSPGFQLTGQASSQDGGLTPAMLLRDGLPAAATAANLSPSVVNGQSASYVEQPAMAMPRAQDWSLTVASQIYRDLTFEASYIGLHATRQVAAALENINQVDSRYLSLGSLLLANINSAAARAAKIPIPWAGFNGTVAQALRPYPQYQTLTSIAGKYGAAKYEALELRLRQRFHGGLSLEANYAWSKNLGYVDPSNAVPGASSNYLQDQYNRGLEWALTPNDVPHAFVAQYAYDLPFGKGKRWLGSQHWQQTTFGGWTFSGVHRYQSGFPLQLSMSNSLPIFNSVLRPDLVAGVDPGSGIGNADFNPATDRRANLSAFSAPSAYRFGTAPPTLGGLRQFPVLSEDFSITKATTLRERVLLEAYGQFFNAFNRHRFTGFVTNFSSSVFAMAQSTSLPRFVQLGLKLSF